MRRARWRSHRPKITRKRRMMWALAFLFFGNVWAFVWIDRNLTQPLAFVAQVRLKQIATEAINKALTEQMAQHGSDVGRLIDWRTDETGKVKAFSLNYAEHLKITADAVRTVQDVLKRLERMPERIPVGQAMKSSLLASFGPRVPVRLEPAGSVKVDLKTRHYDAGINMLLVEVYLRVEAQVAIIIPFDSRPETVATEVPISYVLVVGDVPAYYFDHNGNPLSGGVSPPNVALPPLRLPSPAPSQ